MSGWLYLIKNGDLYKIGITKNFDNRMRQLKPDYVVDKLYSNNFKQLERELHKRYKNVRIPQTEYFRLDDSQIREIKKRIRQLSYPRNITLTVLIKIFILLIFIFLFVILFLSLTINDFKRVLFSSLLWMERISFGLSFVSIFINSDRYLSFFNEIKFRSTRVLVFILFAVVFRYSYRYLF